MEIILLQERQWSLLRDTQNMTRHDPGQLALADPALSRVVRQDELQMWLPTSITPISTVLWCCACFKQKIKIHYCMNRQKRPCKTNILPGFVRSVEIEIGKERLKWHEICNSPPACCIYNMLRVITSN